MSAMVLSAHAEKRMQQRGRRPREIDFVLEHGTETVAGMLLTERDAAKLEQEARQIIEMAQRLRNVLVPYEGRTIKTVFRASRVQQRRLL